MLDQILTNPAWRAVGYIVLVALGYAAWKAAYLIICAEMQCRAQRKADRIKRKADEIAKASNVRRHLCGMDER